MIFKTFVGLCLTPHQISYHSSSSLLRYRITNLHSTQDKKNQVRKGLRRAMRPFSEMLIKFFL